AAGHRLGKPQAEQSGTVALVDNIGHLVIFQNSRDLMLRILGVLGGWINCYRRPDLSFEVKTLRKIEWPTLLVLALTYAVWGLGTTWVWEFSPILAVLITGLAVAQHS